MNSHHASIIKPTPKHSFRLILIISLALFGFQLASVTHHHDNGQHAVIDNCLICSASSISSASGALTTNFQLIALDPGSPQSSAIRQARLCTGKTLAFRSRAPPVFA